MAVVFAAVAAVAMWNHPVVMQATRAESDLLKLVVAAVSPLICWLLLICTLVCAALIERDRQPVPVRLFWPACVVGVLAAYFVPLVPLGHLGGGLLPGIAGLLIGAGWGGTLLVIEAACVGQRAASEHASERRWSHLGRVMAPRVAALAACGVLLGWQVTAMVVVGVAICHWLCRCWLCALGREKRDSRWFVCCAGGAVLLLLLWPMFLAGNPWLGIGANFDMLVFALPMVIVCALLTAWTTGGETSLDPALPDKNQGAEVYREAGPQEMLGEAGAEWDAAEGALVARPALRPTEMQMEMLKPDRLLTEHAVNSTIVIFGSAHIVEREQAVQQVAAARAKLAEAPEDPRRQREVDRQQSLLEKSNYYEAAREFSRLVSLQGQQIGRGDYVVVSGGGSGIMEAANRGAAEVGAPSIGLSRSASAEQVANRFVSPELSFCFQHDAMRTLHFLRRATALVVFPGGLGTLDELFHALALRQTNRMQPIPIILYGTDYWERVIHWPQLVEEGMIQDDDLALLQFADNPATVWEIICGVQGDAGEI